MKLITLTNRHGDKIYINIEQIGHFYQEIESGNWGGEERGRKITIVGAVTHNNGGFKVLETPEEIMKLIKENLK